MAAGADRQLPLSTTTRLRKPGEIDVYYANQPGTAWMVIVKKNGTTEFTKVFNPRVEMAASVLPEALSSVNSVSAVLGVTGKLYESIAFTHEVVEGSRTYLTWEGRYQGRMCPVPPPSRETSQEQSTSSNFFIVPWA